MSPRQLPTEYCPDCDRETPHDVVVDVRREAPDDQAGFSREPYRMASCEACGHETTQRMNNA